MKIMEDKFKFNKVTKGSPTKYYTLKESELDQKHLDTLLRELIIKWHDSPLKVRQEFSIIVLEAYVKIKQNEK